MELIQHHFGKKLNAQQIAQFQQLKELYTFWNEKINVISRQDIDNLYDHHILHSLSIAFATSFASYTHILDIGTGGGFPGIPLAIMFPQARFHLIDATAKKIKVVNEVANALQLKNVKAQQLRVEQLHDRIYDYVVSRGVTNLNTLYEWSKRLVTKNSELAENKLANGLIALKGGDLHAEVQTLPNPKLLKWFLIGDYIDLPYYEEKFILHLKV